MDEEKCETKEEAIEMAQMYLDGRRSSWNQYKSVADAGFTGSGNAAGYLIVDACRANAYAALATVLPKKERDNK